MAEFWNEDVPATEVLPGQVSTTVDKPRDIVEEMRKDQAARYDDAAEKCIYAAEYLVTHGGMDKHAALHQVFCDVRRKALLMLEDLGSEPGSHQRVGFKSEGERV